MENNPNSSQNNIDQKKLQNFMEVVLSDLGGAYSAVLVYIGDKLGLYKAMKDAGSYYCGRKYECCQNHK